MNKNNYNSIIKVANNNTLGDIKSIRIFKLFALEEKISKDVLSSVLQEDVDFAIKILGKPLEILCETVNFEKSIIILKHENSKTTHISLNLFDKPIKTNFKIEVVGDSGILEYDSSKNQSIVLSGKNEKNIVSLDIFNVEDYGDEVKTTIEKIMAKF